MNIVISKEVPILSKRLDRVMGVPARRVEDRIRELCAEAVAAKSSHKAQLILAELRLAIRQYTQRLRNRAAAVFIGCSDLPPERRKTSTDRGQRAAQ